MHMLAAADIMRLQLYVGYIGTPRDCRAHICNARKASLSNHPGCQVSKQSDTDYLPSPPFHGGMLAPFTSSLSSVSELDEYPRNCNTIYSKHDKTGGP